MCLPPRIYLLYQPYFFKFKLMPSHNTNNFQLQCYRMVSPPYTTSDNIIYHFKTARHIRYLIWLRWFTFQRLTTSTIQIICKPRNFFLNFWLAGTSYSWTYSLSTTRKKRLRWRLVLWRIALLKLMFVLRKLTLFYLTTIIYNQRPRITSFLRILYYFLLQRRRHYFYLLRYYIVFGSPFSFMRLKKHARRKRYLQRRRS